MVNVADVAPWATVTADGIVAATMFDDNVTTAPPGGAPVVSVTVPVDAAPPVTDDGVALTALNAAAGGGGGGFTVNDAVLDTPLYAAVNVPGVCDDTTDVPRLNVADVAPWATVTDAGTVAAAMFDDNVTTAPPEGAPAVSVTVPVDAEPPVTDDGFALTALNAAAGGGAGGFTVNVAVFDTPP